MYGEAHSIGGDEILIQDTIDKVSDEIFELLKAKGFSYNKCIYILIDAAEKLEEMAKLKPFSQ